MTDFCSTFKVFIGLAQPGGGKVAGAYSLGTCRTSSCSFPNEISQTFKKKKAG